MDGKERGSRIDWNKQAQTPVRWQQKSRIGRIGLKKTSRHIELFKLIFILQSVRELTFESESDNG